MISKANINIAHLIFLLCIYQNMYLPTQEVEDYYKENVLKLHEFH